MKISVIIPAFNEEKTISATLEDLCIRHAPDEVIVADGGSTDRTRELARRWARVVLSPKGRARQLNAGAREAQGDILLFLHADTRLPAAGLEKVREAAGSGVEGGRFRMKFDEDGGLLRFYSRYTRFHFFSYGDQGFFVRRVLFWDLGGYREDVPFEDIDFYHRLQRQTTPVILPDAVVTSARRFRQIGAVRQKLLNVLLVSLHFFGLDVRGLQKRLYPEVR